MVSQALLTELGEAHVVAWKEVEVVFRRLARWLARERGTSAVEYAILASFVAAVIVAIVQALGGKVSSEFSTVNSLYP